MAERSRHQAGSDDVGRRLDQFLAALHPDLSRSRLQALIDQGLVLVDGAAAKASRRLKGSEVVEVEIPPPIPTEPEPQDLPLQILYEDEALLVIDKAPGMVVHPGAGVQDETLVNALLFHIQDLGEAGEERRPGIVHRLDRDTSGCLVVAKDDRSLALLQEAFRSRKVEKIYLALVHGEVAEDRFTIDTPYGRHPTQRTKFTTRNPAGIARRAITHVQVRERFAGATLVEVDLETGRTHQIRVHLSEAGHPLLADATYGGTRREARLAPVDPVRQAAQAIGRQALHAHRLGFPHPTRGERLSFEAPLPADFEAALQRLRDQES